jgi:hypothetical protein
MKARTKVITVTILIFVIVFILTCKKEWDYEKTNLVEYNPEYNEKHKPFDTIPTLYTNTKPIILRKFKDIGGHAVIGEINGGSRNIIIHDLPNCKTCKDFFLSLKSD